MESPGKIKTMTPAEINSEINSIILDATITRKRIAKILKAQSEASGVIEDQVYAKTAEPEEYDLSHKALTHIIEAGRSNLDVAVFLRQAKLCL